ncbi:MAG: PAS domain S-box protein [Flavobacteriales bacterium]|nr:PAS domain S-box protein [Flavobacteriales bacterium]
MKDINKGNYINFSKEELFGQIEQLKILSNEHEERTSFDNSENFLKAQHLAKLGFIDWDISRNEMKWSDEIYNIWGFDRNTKLNLESINGSVHPEDIAYVEESLEMALAGTKEYNIDYRIVRPNNEICWIQAQAELKRDHKGEAVKFLGTALDITERKMTEMALARNEKNLSLIYDTAGDVLFQVKVESDGYRFLTVNKTFLSATGIPREAIVGKRIDEVIPEPALTLVKGKYAEAIRIKKPVRWEETSHYPTGEKMGVVTIAPFYDEDGECTHLVGSVHDITERDKAEKELLQYKENLEEIVKKRTDELSKSKEAIEQTLKELKAAQLQLIQSEKMASLGQLTAGIAHEINNPMNFITAGIEGLSKDFVEYSKVMEKYESLEKTANGQVMDILKDIKQLKADYEFNILRDSIPQAIEDIAHGAYRTTEIVKGLRYFSRIDTDRMIKADLHAGLNSTLQILNNKKNDQIKIVKRYDPALPLVVCHLGQINQVFMNLINNAIDACEGSGIIIITTSTKKESVIISIKDDGIGILEEIKHKVFDPFFTTKEIGKGTGLGLSISHGIIENHKGNIKVISKTGKGATFTITLPINTSEK